MTPPEIAVEQAALIEALRALGYEVDAFRPAGSGWWSRCFAFADGRRSLVIRVGSKRAYFGKDRIAARWSGPDLPIPAVYHLEPFRERWLCVSDRCEGVALESLGPDDFAALIPEVSLAIRAMAATTPAGTGWGEFDATGRAPYESWRACVASAFGASHDPDFRSAGWRTLLGSELAAVVDTAEARLASLAIDDVPRAVVHADLLHGNVHVAEGRLTGIFDWGAAAYADPRFELACFEFWHPWHRAIDLDALTTAVGEVPNAADRRAACFIQIGVSHIAFNAERSDIASAQATADRLIELVDL
ncbi:MAG: phosphotransferase [Actinomycetota bacterium]